MPGQVTGSHHASHASELRLHQTRGDRARLALCIVALLVLPFLLNNYWLSIVNAIGIAAIGAIGLNILVGFTGQISLGQGGFLAVGGFTSALLAGRLGLPIRWRSPVRSW
jgi:branched-chain amino acid transport system permease protein